MNFLVKMAVFAILLPWMSSAAELVVFSTYWTGFPIPDAQQMNYVTQVNFFGYAPNDWTGNLQTAGGEPSSSKIASLHSNGIKAFMTIGGANLSTGFKVALASGMRSTFTSQVVSKVSAMNYDGVDIDWEYPQTTGEAADFIAFVTLLKQQLPAGKKISIDYPSVIGQGNETPALEAAFLGSGMYNTVDYINVMNYDLGGSCTVDPNHAPFPRCQVNMEYWLTRGIPIEKMVYGLPFYARNCNRSTEQTSSYATLGISSDDIDNIGNFYFNSLNTVKSKANWVRHSGAAGVMGWELSQDLSGSSFLSLLKGIDSVLKASWGGSSTPPSGTLAKSWIPNTAFATSDIIYHEGGYWKASLNYNANVEPLDWSASQTFWGQKSSEPFCSSTWKWQGFCTYVGPRGIDHLNKCWQVAEGFTANPGEEPGTAPIWVESSCNACDTLVNGDEWVSGCSYNTGEIVLENNASYYALLAACNGQTSSSRPKYNNVCWVVTSFVQSSSSSAPLSGSSSTQTSSSATTSPIILTNANTPDKFGISQFHSQGFELTSSVGGRLHIQLFDLTGQMLQSIEISSDTPAIQWSSPLPSGLYVLRIQRNHRTILQQKEVLP